MGLLLGDVTDAMVLRLSLACVMVVMNVGRWVGGVERGCDLLGKMENDSADGLARTRKILNKYSKADGKHSSSKTIRTRGLFQQEVKDTLIRRIFFLYTWYLPTYASQSV